MPRRTEPGDQMSDSNRNYLAKGWIVECIDDSESGWLTLKKPEGHDYWVYGAYDTNPCLKKGGLYRVQKADEGYFVELEGVPARWRTNRFKVFTSKLENPKYEVPVKIIKERTITQREVSEGIEGMTKRKILVVAEVDTLGVFLSRLLKDFDVTVVGGKPIKESFMEIRAELSTKKYDLVLITNNGLPPRIILEIIPEIKRISLRSKIIVLSGWDINFEWDLKEQGGIDDFLSMPFDGNNLVQKVKSVIDKGGRLTTTDKDLISSFFERRFKIGNMMAEES